MTATEAARNFATFLNHVCYRGETYVIERAGKPVCQLSPVAPQHCSGRQLMTVLASLPHPSEAFLSLLEEISNSQSMVEASPWEK